VQAEQHVPPVPTVPLVSIVLPVFNEEATLPELYRRLTQSMAATQKSHEIIFVNDGSKDRSYALLCELVTQDEHVRVINFSRNFGHQIALTAGLDYSRGQAVIIMDADLQDPPEVLPTLIEKWQEGYDIVYAVRAERTGEGMIKRGTAALFYRLLHALAKIEIPLDTGDFRLMSRRAVNALQSLRERHRFVRGLSSWIGFRQTAVSFVREARYAGETKYPLAKVVKLAFDGVSAFSFLPLRLATYLGFSAALVSFCYIAYAIGQKVFADTPVFGWASLIVAVLFVGGVQLITLGILGEYVGRIYEEVKQRPLYIVADTVGFAGETVQELEASNARRPLGTEVLG